MSDWPTIEAGEDVELPVPVLNAAGEPFPDLNDVDAIEFQVRRYVAVPGEADDSYRNPVLLSKAKNTGITISGSTATVALSRAETAALDGDYHADLWVTSGGKRKRAKGGKLTVERTGNQP